AEPPTTRAKPLFGRGWDALKYAAAWLLGWVGLKVLSSEAQAAGVQPQPAEPDRDQCPFLPRSQEQPADEQGGSPSRPKPDSRQAEEPSSGHRYSEADPVATSPPMQGPSRPAIGPTPPSESPRQPGPPEEDDDEREVIPEQVRSPDPNVPSGIRP